MAGFTVTRRGPTDVHEYGRPAQGLVFPSGGDDTAAINQAITAGKQLGSGTFLFSGTINGVPRGQGAIQTTLRATNAAAKMQLGPALGSTSAQDAGIYGGFTLDGNNVASGPLLQTNSVKTTFLPISVQNSLGDGVVVAGQNTTWIALNSGSHQGCGLALDAGAGGHVFIAPELIACAQYHLEFRQTVASPANAFPVPEQNRFYGGILEHNTTSAGGGSNLGCLHQLAGAFNYLEGMNFFTENAVNLVYLEPNTALGRSGDTNGRLYLRDCGFTGGSAAIASSATSLGGDIAVTLEGENFFSGQTGTVAIPWTNAIQVVQNGSASLFGLTTSLYAASGAAPALGSTLAPQPQYLTIIPFLSAADASITQGTWTFSADNTAMLSGYQTNSTGAAVNDEIGWSVMLGAGTWVFSVGYRKGTAAGVFEVHLDGVSVGSIDSYNAAASNNNLQAFTGIHVLSSGKHFVSIKVTGKNASSTNFWAMVHMLQLRRSA